MTSEKSELNEEATRIIKTIRQMEASLEDPTSNKVYQLEDKDLKVTIPLTRCLQTLKERHNAVAKIHCERFEQVKSMDVYRKWKAGAKSLQNLSRLSNHILLT